MGCIELMDYKILQSRVSFKECREFIRGNYKEVYEVEPGYQLFDAYLIGNPPIFVGVDGDDLIFPYVKPCHGAFVLKIKGPDVIERLRRERKAK
ncbi:MAG TPA: DUF1894 domain-containing protein [Methanomicrobia archaeon]|nr:DUF1894 domain-containing protein [Methanomicrobia archaeon]